MEALKQKDVNEADRIWHRMAEGYLLYLFQTIGHPQKLNPEKQRRGDPPKFIEKPVIAPQVQSSSAVGAATKYLNELTNFQGRISELSFKLQRRQALQGLGKENSWTLGDETSSRNLWRKVYRGCFKHFSRKTCRELSLVEPPTVEAIAKLDQFAKEKIAKHVERAHERRKKFWAPLLVNDAKNNYSKNTFRHIKNKTYTPLVAVLDNHTGLAVTAPKAMHKNMYEAWKPIYEKHDMPEEAIKEKVDSYMFKFGDFIPTVEFKPRRVSGQQLHYQVQKMKPTSRGLDGWFLAEFKKLPLVLWHFRAEVQDLVSELGKWPDSQLYAYQAQLAKVEEMLVASSLQTRGIRVYTVLYRSWGGVCYSELQEWQECWADPGLHGANRTHEAIEPFLEIGLEMVFSVSDGEEFSAGSLDGVKHFDFFIFQLTAAILTKAGLPAALVALLLDIWSRQRVRVKLLGHFGPVFTPKNGLGQGDSWSLICTNLDSVVWMCFIKSVVAGTRRSAFIDDRGIRNISGDRLLAGLQVTDLYDQATGHELNIIKSALMSTDSKVRNKFRKVRIRGKQLPVPVATRYLGLQLKLTKAKSGIVTNNASGGFKDAAKRVRALPFSNRRKAGFINSVSMQKLSFSAISNIPSLSSRENLASCMIEAAWGSNRKLRCKEIVVTQFMDISRVDPKYGPAIRILRDVHRILRKRRAMAAQFRVALRICDREQLQKLHTWVRQFLLALQLLGLQMDDDLFVDGPDAGKFPFLKVGSKWLEARLNSAANFQTLVDLHKRCDIDTIDASQETEADSKRKGRKDMVGIIPLMDRKANRVWLDDEAKDCQTKSIRENFPDMPAKLSVQEKGKVESILSGSLRLNDRLSHCPGIQTKQSKACKCGHPVEDAPHMFWECQHPPLCGGT